MSRPGQWAVLWRNFLKSLSPNKIDREIVGRDKFGNKFYIETHTDRGRGQAYAKRGYQPPDEEEWDARDRNLLPEWEAWLRGRRKYPPSDEEQKISDAKLQHRIHKGQNRDQQDALLSSKLSSQKVTSEWKTEEQGKQKYPHVDSEGAAERPIKYRQFKDYEDKNR